MRVAVLIFTVLCINMACQPEKLNQSTGSESFPITLVIHGGAGTIRKENMTAERERKYHEALQHALDTGYSVLQKGGRSLDAVIAAVTFLENSPLFNAGKGAVFTYSGKNELDASTMPYLPCQFIGTVVSFTKSPRKVRKRFRASAAYTLPGYFVRNSR